MSSFSRMFAGDEELGKKDDDHRPLNGGRGGKSKPWSARKPTQGLRKRGIIYILCAILFIYLFIKNIPTDLGPNSSRGDARVPRAPADVRKPNPSDPQGKKPPRPAIPPKNEEHYHDGPIKFYKLAASLHAAARLGGQLATNKNVLFAASSLASVAEIVPLACEMARWERNDVHLAVMGREDMSIDEIKEVNRAEEDCDVHWHDARPDYSRYSSDFRMAVSVTASMEHIQTLLHPQIIIIDDPTREDDFFVDALRTKVVDMGKGMIELPKDAAETMMWMTRLDSGALAAWPTTYVDIFIQAPKQASGALVRLLRSIEDADYFGIRRPHLTIELPADIDPPTWRYLQNFIWPPLDWNGRPHTSQVTLRHRIPRQTSSQEEASARLVESFYPLRTDSSNVLLLSPQVELSPLYYHYLIYSILEYKHSDYNKGSKDAGRLVGVSLHLPSYYPNDTTPLDPPKKAKKDDDKSEKSESAFLWQMPDADAALFFGNKWMEFHSFISNRVSKPPTDFPKVFSESHPAWLEYLLEIMRARGWFMMYPNLPNEDASIATLHSELFEVPEEFSNRRSRRRSIDKAGYEINPDDALTADETAPIAPPDDEKPLLSSDLISVLPASGDLPEVANLPFISFNGHRLSTEELGRSAITFSETFRKETGACDNGQGENPYRANSAEDLFCHLEEIYDHHAAALSQTASPQVDTGPSPYEDYEPTVFDEDVMSPAAADEAKSLNELGSHMDRQEGKEPTSSSMTREKMLDQIGVPQHPRLPDVDEADFDLLQHPEKARSEVDSSDDRQSEFRAQMERQAIQNHAGISSLPSRKQTDPVTSATTGDDEEVAAGPKEKDGTSPSAAPETAAAGSPPAPTMHGSFKKEVPKQPQEDSSASGGAAPDAPKGAGW